MDLLSPQEGIHHQLLLTLPNLLDSLLLNQLDILPSPVAILPSPVAILPSPLAILPSLQVTHPHLQQEHTHLPLPTLPLNFNPNLLLVSSPPTITPKTLSFLPLTAAAYPPPYQPYP